MKIMVNQIYLLIYLIITFNVLKTHTVSAAEHFKIENTTTKYTTPNMKHFGEGAPTNYNVQALNYGGPTEHSTQVNQLFDNKSTLYGEVTNSDKRYNNNSSFASRTDVAASKKVKFLDILSNANSIIRFLFLILAFVGLCCNSLSFLIVVKQGLIKSGIWVYVACLALTDNMAIIMECINIFSKHAPYNFLGDIFATNVIICKILTSFSYLWSMISNYILCLMTTERCVLVLRPFKSPPGQKQALINVIIVSIVISIIQSSYIWPIQGLVKFDLTDKITNSTISLDLCTVVPQYQNYAYLTTIFAIDTIVYAALPIFIIISANSLIVYGLMKRVKNPNLTNTNRNLNKDKNITYMLLAISSYFFISLTPSVIYSNTWQFFYESFEEATSTESIPWTILLFFCYSNHCCNFIFYVLSGETFREKIRLFIKNLKCCKETSAEGVTRSRSLSIRVRM